MDAFFRGRPDKFVPIFFDEVTLGTVPALVPSLLSVRILRPDTVWLPSTSWPPSRCRLHHSPAFAFYPSCHMKCPLGLFILKSHVPIPGRAISMPKS